MKPTESYILCEGFHDRTFWSSLLKRLGCSDPGYRHHMGRVPVKDPFGGTVAGGKFGLLSKSNNFIRIVPAGGKSLIAPAAELRLSERDHALTRLVLNVDSDKNADGTPSPTMVFGFAEAERVVRKVDPAFKKLTGTTWVLFEGETIVELVTWACSSGVASAIPNQQTLERLVCSAIAVAYPDRGECVARWLASRPKPPQPNPKEHAWSHLAGWYGELSSYEALWPALWNDPKIAAALDALLAACGAGEVSKLLST